MKKEAQFIEHIFGKFRHFTPILMDKYIILSMPGQDLNQVFKQAKTYTDHIINAQKHCFIESYLHGSPEAEYYGLN